MQHSIPDSSFAQVQLNAETASRFLRSVTRIADASSSLGIRRQMLLCELGAEIDAAVGIWAWGRGGETAQTPAPLAMIHFGFDENCLASYIAAVMAPETDREFRDPIMRRMTGARLTCLRQDVFTTEQWRQTKLASRFHAFNCDEWIHSISFSNKQFWANLAFFRRAGSAPFSEADRLLVDVAMSSVSWLAATCEELLPTDRVCGLTPRQRMVMLMLLDGLPRKQIAVRLGITEQTVGDHLKQVYATFKVNSASDLSAIFLRDK